MRIKILLFASLLTVFICSNTSSNKEEELVLPPSVWSRICDVNISEGIKKGSVIYVVRQTRPTYDFDGFLYPLLGDEHGPDELEKMEKAHDLSVKMYKEHEPVPIRVPEASNGDACKWTAVSSLKDRIIEGENVLEISNLVKNPYDGQTGVFLRFSISGLSAISTYWMSLKKDPAGAMEVLDIQEIGTIHF